MRALLGTADDIARCSHCCEPLWSEGEHEDGGCGTCMDALDQIGPLLQQAACGPHLRMVDRAAAAAMRRDLLALLDELPPVIAIQVLETFDFGSPRPMAGYPRHAVACREYALWLALEAAGIGDAYRLDQLRREVCEAVVGWPASVVAWHGEQVDLVAAAFTEPIAWIVDASRL